MTSPSFLPTTTSIRHFYGLSFIASAMSARETCVRIKAMGHWEKTGQSSLQLSGEVLFWTRGHRILSVILRASSPAKGKRMSPNLDSCAGGARQAYLQRIIGYTGESSQILSMVIFFVSTYFLASFLWPHEALRCVSPHVNALVAVRYSHHKRDVH